MNVELTRIIAMPTLLVKIQLVRITVYANQASLETEQFVTVITCFAFNNFIYGYINEQEFHFL